MKFKIIIISILLFSAFNSHAISPVNNAQLSDIVAKAETLKNEQNYFDAAAAYLDALNLTNPAVISELNEIKQPDKNPYVLRLHLMRLLCLEKAGERTSTAFEKECRQIIDKYKNQANSNLWPHYISIYQQLLNHYSELHEISAFNNTLFEILDSEPRYLPFLAYFFINSNFNGLSYSKINNIIKNYENSDARIYPNVDYLKLKIIERTGGDTFTAAYDFMKNYPHFEYINNVVKIMGNSIDRSKSDQLEKHQRSLVVLAIKQPYDKENTSTIALILNEINPKPNEQK